MFHHIHSHFRVVAYFPITKKINKREQYTYILTPCLYSYNFIIAIVLIFLLFSLKKICSCVVII